MQGSNETGSDPTTTAVAIVVVVGLATIVVLLIEWPILVWSTLHGRPTLMDPGAALGGALRALFTRRLAAPRSWAAWVDVLPPTAAWIASDVAGLALVGIVVLGVLGRLDRWRGR